MSIIKRFADFLAQIETWLVAALGLALVAVVFLGVLYRYVLREPLAWAYELSILMFIWVTFLGASLGIHKNAHVTFDFLTLGMSPMAQRIVRTIGMLLVFALAISGVIYGSRVFTNTISQRFQTIPFSRGWMYAGLPVGMALMAVHAVERALAIATGKFTA